MDGHGNRKLCCLAKPFENQKEMNALDLKEYGEKISVFREQFLKGEIPETCKGCEKGQPNHELKVNTNRNLINEYKRLAEGHEENFFAPVYMDYRIDNACNLSCLSCNEYLSSGVEARFKQAGIPVSVDKIQRERFFKEYLHNLEALEFGTLYFASGEPFVSRFNWEIQKTLKGKEDQFRLSYHSNLSSLKNYGQEDLTEVFKKFKGVNLAFSLDAIGEVGETLRTGLNFEKWKENFETLNRAGLTCDSKIHCVLSIPALMELESLQDFCHELSTPLVLGSVAGENHELLLNPKFLPENYLETLPRELQKTIGRYEDYKSVSRERWQTVISHYYKIEPKLIKYYENHAILKDWFYDLKAYAFLKDGVLDLSQGFIKGLFDDLSKEASLVIMEIHSSGWLKSVLNSTEAQPLDFSWQENWETVKEPIRPQINHLFKREGIFQKILYAVFMIFFFLSPKNFCLKERLKLIPRGH